MTGGMGQYEKGIGREKKRIKLSGDENRVPKPNRVHSESDFHKRCSDATASSSFTMSKFKITKFIYLNKFK